MDLRCPVCAEPWDNDELHYLDIPYSDAAKRFRREGCAVFGSRHAAHDERPLMADAASVLYGLLGDDMDGAASMLEDFEAGY